MSRFGMIIGTGLIAATALTGILVPHHAHAATSAQTVVADGTTPTATPTPNSSVDPNSFVWQG